MKRFKMLTVIVLVMGCVLCLSGQLWANEAAKVNINTASAEELASLKKVGLKTASRIVEYRSTVGMFKAPEELMNVKGIGEKIFELNKDRIIVGNSEKPAPKSDKNVSQHETTAGKKG